MNHATDADPLLSLDVEAGRGAAGAPPVARAYLDAIVGTIAVELGADRGPRSNPAAVALALKAANNLPLADRLILMGGVVDKQFELIAEQNRQLAALRGQAHISRVYWVIAMCFGVALAVVSFAFVNCQHAQ